MTDVAWWGAVVLPVALGIGGILVVGVWYRRRGASRTAIAVRVVVAALAGFVGYVLLALPVYTTREPFWRVSEDVSNWGLYALLLYFGLAIGLGTGRDGWPLGVGYLVVLGAIYRTTGPETTPLLALNLGVLGLGFLIEDRIL